jgi:hypothetical protein
MRNERDSELTFTWFSARKGRQYEGTTKQVFLRICLYASMHHTFTQLSIWHPKCTSPQNFQMVSWSISIPQLLNRTIVPNLSRRHKHALIPENSR